jgi:Ca2+-binding RTX toxin-like protein
MRKKLVATVLTVISINLLLVGAAFAEYDSSNDITVSVTVLEDEVKTSDETGEFTFEAQEGVHELITDTSGEEVDHSYIWIEVNGNKVLAIDPPKPCFN